MEVILLAGAEPVGTRSNYAAPGIAVVVTFAIIES